MTIIKAYSLQKPLSVSWQRTCNTRKNKGILHPSLQGQLQRRKCKEEKHREREREKKRKATYRGRLSRNTCREILALSLTHLVDRGSLEAIELPEVRRRLQWRRNLSQARCKEEIGLIGIFDERNIEKSQCIGKKAP